MPSDHASAISATIGRADWGLLLALSVLWGGSFVFVGMAVSELPVLTIVTLRVGLAALALWTFVLLSGRGLPRAPRVWTAFLGMGLLNNVIPFGLMVWGQQSIAAGLAAILNAATPLFTVLVAGAVLADERITSARLGGVILGLCGVAVMVGPDALGGLSVNVLAQLAVLAGALSYAFAGVFGRRFRRLGIDPVTTAAGQVAASALILAPVTVVIDRPWGLPTPSASVLGAVAGLALLSTAVAYVIYFRLLARVGATNLLLVTFLIPVSAVALGVLFLGEQPGWDQAAGAGLIAAGLAMIDARVTTRFSRGGRSSPANQQNG